MSLSQWSLPWLDFLILQLSWVSSLFPFPVLLLSISFIIIPYSIKFFCLFVYCQSLLNYKIHGGKDFGMFCSLLFSPELGTTSGTQQAPNKISVEYNAQTNQWCSLVIKEKKYCRALCMKIWAGKNQVNLSVLRCMFKTTWRLLLYCP